MKHAKKLASLLLALVMALAVAVPVFAQDVGTDADGKGTITISNAAKGETYTIYQLFDAVVSQDGDSIVYTGSIPESLGDYFTADANGYITATDAAKAADGSMSDGLRAALKEWAKTATATAAAESDGSTLNFRGLDYGYYVVTTTQGEQTISVDSTMPNVTIVDKNSSTPSGLTKTVDDDTINIGDTVTYTVSFQTSNYDGAGESAKKIVSYTIEDTLPDFLTNVAVTSIIVDDDGDTTTTDDQHNVTASFTNKKITLDWYDEAADKFLYDNGATVTIVYTAVVTDKAAIDGDGNTNRVTVTWNTKDGPASGKLEEEETIYTFAIALKKVNEKGEALGGAVFQLPFYVKETPDAADGAYIYAGTTSGEGLTNQLTTPDDGVMIIKGVENIEYTVTEVTAPDGYNKLLNPVTVTAVQTGKTTTHMVFYLDENGNIVEQKTDTTIEVLLDNDKIAAAAALVVNKSGTELPSTGGIGTTIFYVIGSILLVGAAVLLITKKRVNAAQ